MQLKTLKLQNTNTSSVKDYTEYFYKEHLYYTSFFILKSLEIGNSIKVQSAWQTI